MSTVVTMSWGPIGEWDVLDNGVMKLASDVCELTLYKTNGMKIQVSPFQRATLDTKLETGLQCIQKRRWK